MRSILAIAVFATWVLGLISCNLRRGIENYEANAQQLKSDLGFDHGSPYVTIDDNAQEVFTIESIANEGAFARSGVREGDIVMDVSIREFYDQLEAHRGGTYTFSVVEGGDGPALPNRTMRTISVTIPSKR
ncbi:MAG: hypothetical protein MI807_20225 [Verrucomicrobiales bacterium]|nr:hypothetical protein [Verrucomicrobiales bacterium]